MPRRDGKYQPWEVTLAAIEDGLDSGERFQDILKQIRIPAMAVWANADRDDVFREALEAALMRNRNPDQVHGTTHGYKLGCRCHECRAAKAVADFEKTRKRRARRARMGE